MNLERYPLLVPPEHLAKKGARDWSANEAIEYKEWLLGCLDERVQTLTVMLDERAGPTPSAHLSALGYKIAVLIKNAPFSEEGECGNKLTNQGYALAADMGLLVAKYLLSAFPNKLRWETLRKPKAELSYNLPVLKGFSSTYLDPIGGSTAEASAVLRGKRGPDTWKRMYEDWLAQC